MHLDTDLILASRSPRRQRLLATLGIPFEVRVADIPEVRLPDESPEKMVCRLAVEKATAVARNEESALFLGADTAVVLGEELFGKPADDIEARDMLQRLSGRTHVVLTGIALVHTRTARVRTAVEATEVIFDDLSSREIESYVATGSTMDKAGGYGIQDDRGALFVSGIRGDFYNVMGLPLRRLYRLLRTEFGDLIESEEAT